MSKACPKSGDVFAIPLPSRDWVFGRILLDIWRAARCQSFPEDSPLHGLGKAYLVEMYRNTSPTPDYLPSDIVIPGAFVESDKIPDSWPVVDHQPVDPANVRFPESIIGHMHAAGETAFLCGEIRLPLPLTLSEADEIGVYQTRHSAFLWPYTCLRYLGRTSEIPDDYSPTTTLDSSDLRFTAHRPMIYSYLPIAADDCYWDQQKQLGLDLARLYDS